MAHYYAENLFPRIFRLLPTAQGGFLCVFNIYVPNRGCRALMGWEKCDGADGRVLVLLQFYIFQRKSFNKKFSMEMVENRPDKCLGRFAVVCVNDATIRPWRGPPLSPSFVALHAGRAKQSLPPSPSLRGSSPSDNSIKHFAKNFRPRKENFLAERERKSGSFRRLRKLSLLWARYCTAKEQRIRLKEDKMFSDQGRRGGGGSKRGGGVLYANQNVFDSLLLPKRLKHLQAMTLIIWLMRLQFDRANV